MKHPTPSDFLVEVKEAYVSVTFKPSDSHYSFGRLADPEDIARYGPLSQPLNMRKRKTGDSSSAARGPVAPIGLSFGLRMGACIAQCLNLEREFHHTASKLCILGFEPLK